MKKVLITGGTGFLGSHLTKRIIDEVESVTIVTTDIRQQTTLKTLGVDVDKIKDYKVSLNQLRIISYKEKDQWSLMPKYNIGNKKGENEQSEENFHNEEQH